MCWKVMVGEAVAPVLKPRVEVEYAWIRMVVLLSFMYDYANFAWLQMNVSTAP